MFRITNHSQDERPWRVRLCQGGELPLPFLCLILIVFVRFFYSRHTKRASWQAVLFEGAVRSEREPDAL